MNIPRWSTIGLVVGIVLQFVLAWLQAKKTGKRSRESVLPKALMAGALSIMFVREFFGEIPVWIEAPIAVLCFLMILFALGFWLVQLKRHLKDAWRLEDESDK